MNRQHFASMVLVSATMLSIGIAVAAEDRYTLKSPSGTAYSEFKGYETWQAIAPAYTADASGVRFVARA